MIWNIPIGVTSNSDVVAVAVDGGEFVRTLQVTITVDADAPVGSRSSTELAGPVTGNGLTYDHVDELEFEIVNEIKKWRELFYRDSYRCWGR
jgi:hypothetical protein